MYQAIFPEGQLECERFEETENGIELYDGSDDFLAFVPYASLHAIIDADVYTPDDGGDAAIL